MATRKTRNDDIIVPLRKQLIVKEKFAKTEGCLIPQDLIMEILARLPPKSMARFRCVDRSLCSFLSDPSFLTKMAIRESQNQGNHRFLCLSDNKYLYEVVSNETKDGVNYSLYGQLQPVKFEHLLNKEHSIVGSCNGLLCMVYEGMEFILLNPLTGEGRKLTRAKRLRLRSYPILYGFGYDISNDDHKIVRAEFHVPKRSQGIGYNYIGDVTVSLFSVKEDRWRTLQCRLNSSTIGFEALDAIYFSGVLHWKALNYNDRIISFNLAEEKFGELMVPKANFNRFRIARLSVIQGCLCISQLVGNGCYSLWLMKEYGVEESWSHFVNVNPIYSFPHVSYTYQFCPPPLCYTNGGRLLIGLDLSHITIYNSKEKSVCATWDPRRVHRFSRLIPYVESLVSPYKQHKKMKAAKV